MPERQVIIRNKLGLHARASAHLATEASAFTSKISLVKGSVEVNGKSIMGIMMLAAGKGTEIILRAKGSDAEAALDQLETLINSRFGEEQ